MLTNESFGFLGSYLSGFTTRQKGVLFVNEESELLNLNVQAN